MKIAIVAQPFDTIPPVRGASIAIWADELSTRLSKDHDVSIYCRAAEGQTTEDVKGSVRNVRAATARDEKIIQYLGQLQRGLKKVFGVDRELFYRYYYFSRAYYYWYSRSISRMIRRDGADVIVVPNFSQFVPELRRQNPHSRIVVVMQCDWLVELDRGVVERRLGQIDAVCGCSSYIADGVAGRFPNHAHKCFPLHNASNPDLFVDSAATAESTERLRTRLDLNGKTVVTFVGRVAPEKGVHVLVEAMKRVVEQRPTSVLLVVGAISAQPPSPKWILHRDPEFAEFEALKGRYKEHLDAAAADMGDSVRFIGTVSHYELADYYNLSDIFVHPSIWNEPFGMILTEAMACSRPVVSTRAGGIPEIVVDGETGLLAEPGDSRSLADAILRLVGDEPGRTAMGKRGRERMLSRFTWDHTASRLSQILHELESVSGRAGEFESRGN